MVRPPALLTAPLPAVANSERSAWLGGDLGWICA
uniref:Uncharacterized protein n=1 Tax=Arundo donax TaxID=35708 RepID=A0A0A8ZJY1_ARUDO